MRSCCCRAARSSPLGKFLVGDEAPWNYLMAAAIIYALPPLIIYYGFRRKMSGGLTMGGVKG